MENLDLIRNFLNEENIEFTENNNCFYLPNNVELRYVKISNCNGIPKDYFGKITDSYLKNGKRLIWIKDYEIEQCEDVTQKDGTILKNYHRKWEVLKSYICAATGHVHNRIFARNTYIKKVENNEAIPFLRTHCFYGERSASLTYGLYLKKDCNNLKKDELVMIMSFAPSYYGNKNGSKDIEVIRVGTYVNTQVIGGSSKLLKHFIDENKTLKLKTRNENIEVDRIIFYVDADHNSGSSMEKLGYKFVRHDISGFHNYAVKDIPSLNIKKGTVFSRLPSKNSIIKEEKEKGNIIEIGTAGTLVYEMFIKSSSKKEYLENTNNITFLNEGTKCNICGTIWKTDKLTCPNCNPSVNMSSKGEKELYDLLCSTGLNIINNDRNILNGKELDIYFPDLKFAIEYDGAFWHEKEKDLEKDKLCKEKGIRLLRIDDKKFSKSKNKYLNKIIEILNNDYKQNVAIDSTKINEIIRVSGKNRPIICTDTMEVFNNYLIVGERFNCPSVSDITNVCIGKNDNYKGYHFKYYDPLAKYEQTTPSYDYNCIHVKCIETNEVFVSKNSLKKIGVTAIDDCITGKAKTACGLHWKETEENVTDTSRTINIVNNYLNSGIKIQSTSRKVICIDTGELFETMSAAAKKYNIPKTSIMKCCKGEVRQTHGYHFKYENEDNEFVSKKKTKKVLCVDTGEIFNSLKECVEYFGAPNSDLICRVLNGRRKSYKGHKFEYIA